MATKKAQTDKTGRPLRRHPAVLILALLILITAACGSDRDSGVSSSGPLTVDAALTISDADTHTVEGFAVAVDGALRLCSVLAESDPPQCGGSRIAVVGDATADLEGLFGESLRTKAATAWTDSLVKLTGTIIDGQLHLES